MSERGEQPAAEGEPTPGADEDHGLTRRTLLGGAAALGAAAALPAAAVARRKHHKHQKHHKKRKRKATTPPQPGPAGGGHLDVDVLVVGAGLAGLVAAREIVRAGRSALVLEAQDRVGGRTLNQALPGGGVTEMGGQWIGPGQDSIAALVKEFGVGTFDTYSAGQSVYLYNGNRQQYNGAIPPANPASLAEVLLTITTINNAAQGVPPDTPWRASQAGDYDRQTLEDFLLANLHTAEGRFLGEVAIQSIYSASSAQVSLLDLLAEVARVGGDFNTLIGGAQSTRIVGGSAVISELLAKQLGDRVVLSAPVRRIEMGNRIAASGDRGRWVGREMIVTAPVPITGRIEYDPALPARRDQFTQAQPMGSVIKCAAVYQTPFWRAAGLNGQAIGDNDPVNVTFDNSPPSGSPGVLLGFVEGPNARAQAVLPAAQRRAAVLDSFAAYFGAAARSPVAYFEADWTVNPWIRGGYGSFNPPGVITAFTSTPSDPVGRIHWAGADTATRWSGYMDGAVSTGKRAAREALAAL